MAGRNDTRDECVLEVNSGEENRALMYEGFLQFTVLSYCDTGDIHQSIKFFFSEGGWTDGKTDEWRTQLRYLMVRQRSVNKVLKYSQQWLQVRNELERGKCNATVLSTGQFPLLFTAIEYRFIISRPVAIIANEEEPKKLLSGKSTA